MAPGWAPPVRADVESVPCLAQAPRVPWPFPASPSVALPTPLKGTKPPGLCSCRSLCQEGLLFTTLQMSSPGSVLQHPEHSIVTCLVSRVLREDRDQGHLGHCYVPSAIQHKGSSCLWTVLSACLRVPLTPHPLWVSPLTDQSPGKDSEAWVPDSEERLILREEFTSRMYMCGGR